MTLRVDPAHLVEEATRQGVPLVDIAPSWERVPLGDVACVVNGEAFSSQLFNNTGDGLPLIRIRDVARGRTETYYRGSYKEQSLVRAGDILIGMDGDFAVRRWPGPTALLNQRVCRVDVLTDSLYSGNFLRHCLPGYLNLIWENTPSLTVKHLSSRSLEQIPLPLPPVNEQYRIEKEIEELLSHLAAAESFTTSAVERTGSMSEATRAKLLLARPTRPTRLEEAISIIEAGRSSGGAAPPASPNEWGIIKVSAMTWGSFDANENKRAEPDSIDKRFEICSGDLLVSRANTVAYVGAPVLVGDVRPRLLLSDKSLRLVPRDGIDSRWLLHSLASKKFRSYVSRTATGTKDSMRNISQAALLAGPIDLPSLEDQRAIVALIDDALDQQTRLRHAAGRSADSARHLSAAVLAHAFRGGLTHQNPADEPAAVLLERIRAERDAVSPTKPARRRSPHRATT